MRVLQTDTPGTREWIWSWGGAEYVLLHNAKNARILSFCLYLNNIILNVNHWKKGKMFNVQSLDKIIMSYELHNRITCWVEMFEQSNYKQNDKILAFFALCKSTYSAPQLQIHSRVPARCYTATQRNTSHRNASGVNTPVGPMPQRIAYGVNGP